MSFLSSLFYFLNSHWLLVAFTAPFLWALVNIIDVYFVKGIYKDEIDGTVITGLFQVFPAVGSFLFLYVRTDTSFLSIISEPILLLALCGGFLFNLAFYFYFKALFNYSDVSFLQIIWSLTIIVVPILSFIFSDEVLLPRQYMGMAIVFVGAVTLSFNKQLKKNFSWKYFSIMGMAVLILSVSMVCEDTVYTVLGSKGQSFSLGFLFFSLGSLLNGLCFALVKKRSPLKFIKTYFFIFIVSEVINVFANFTSQKAIDNAPSVSFVAAVETFSPIFIVVLSGLALLFFYISKKRNIEAVRALFVQEIQGGGIKIVATTIMSVGVYILSR